MHTPSPPKGKKMREKTLFYSVGEKKIVG